jgi:copper chaperone CopZ
MTSIEYSVPNISCGHCVHTIERELGELQGILQVRASESDRRVFIEFEPPATEGGIKALLQEINYPPEV